MTSTQLPTDRQRKLLKQLESLESGKSNTEQINIGQAEECCDNGWAQPLPGVNRYALTPKGRALIT